MFLLDQEGHRLWNKFYTFEKKWQGKSPKISGRPYMKCRFIQSKKRALHKRQVKPGAQVSGVRIARFAKWKYLVTEGR